MTVNFNLIVSLQNKRLTMPIFRRTRPSTCSMRTRCEAVFKRKPLVEFIYNMTFYNQDSIVFCIQSTYLPTSV